MRRTLIASSFALVLLALALSPVGATAQCTGLEITGRIVETGPSGPDPVACCDVVIFVSELGGMGPITSVVTTSVDGTFVACMPCGSPTGTYEIQVIGQCCNTQVPPMTVQGCPDPLGGGPQVVDFGDVECLGPASRNRTNYHGQVLCRDGAFTEPVPDCPIVITSQATGDQWFTRTDENGNWEECVECGPVPDILTIESQCCGLIETITRNGCPEEERVQTFICQTCPETPCIGPEEIVTSGQVTCTATLPPVPMPNCPVTLTVLGCSGNVIDVRTTITDANGEYVSCITCGASEDCSTWTIEATPDCCPTARETLQVVGCPSDIVIPTNNCNNAANCQPGNCPTGEGEVTGQVTCLDPLGNPVPVPNCDVQIFLQGCMGGPIFTTTDSNGNYSACVPCACQVVIVNALCCTSRLQAMLDCTQGTVVDLQCQQCPPPPTCPMGEQEIRGQVTCTDPTNPMLSIPQDNCTVLVECLSGMHPPQTATTNPNGVYSLCYPCGCDLIRVTSCCGASVDVDAQGCAGVVANLDCGPCPQPPSCPSPNQVQVSGNLRCDDRDDTAVAGCLVLLTPIDVTGMPLAPVTVVTDGSGNYQDCLDCDNGLSFVRAESECCNSVVDTPVTGCPDQAQLDDLVCTDCRPCPDDYTQVKGRVRCRRGQPVANCQVFIMVDLCTGTETYTTMTDNKGKYRLCVPCPCRGGHVRVSTDCCNSVKKVRVRNCRKSINVKTINCRDCN